MPGASGASDLSRRRLGERVRRARARSRRAARRRAAAASGDRGRRRWSIRCRPRRPAIEDQVDAAAQVGRAHAPRWSARHGRSGWRTARPPACRARAAGPAPPDGRARAWRCCRAPRSQDPRPGSSARFFSTSVSGPGQNAAASRSAAASNAASRSRRRDVGTCAISGLNDGPALGGIEPRDRLAVGGVGAEPVDRLGRERDQPAGGEAARRFGDRRRRPRARTRVRQLGGHARASLCLARALCVRLARDLHPIERALAFEILDALEQPLHGGAIAMPRQQQEFLAHLGAVERRFRRALEVVDAARQRAAILERHRDGRGKRVAVLRLVGHRDRHPRGQRADRRIVERWRR